VNPSLADQPAPDNKMTDDHITALTRAWLEEAVIGLNLCPFAEQVHRNGQIAYYVSHAKDAPDLMDDLTEAIDVLMSSDPEAIDTALLIHPYVLQDFEQYNEFVGWTTDFLEESGLEAELQIASFHPDYRFAGTSPDDITNCTNRSPFPMLHLLREASVDAALTELPEAAQLVEKNLDTLRDLGTDGWDTLTQRIQALAKKAQ
jgi:hypothetical protein